MADLSTWQPVTSYAEAAGISTETVRRRIEAGEIEERDTTEEDYRQLDITRRTKRLVRQPCDGLEDEVDARMDAAVMGVGRLEDDIEWFLAVADGREDDYQAMGGVGGREKVEASLEVRQRARMNAARLREQLEERDRLFLSRDLVAQAMVAVAQTVRDRLQAVPARLAEEVMVAEDANGARRLLAVAVDEVLVELGDAAERELERLLEG